MVKVVVCYRVAQRWRIPLFQDLSLDPRYSFRLFYSADFKGTKVISGDTSRVRSKKLFSLNLCFKFRDKNVYLPIVPTLLWHLYAEKPDVIVCEGKSHLFANIICFIYSKINRVPLVQWGLGQLPSVKPKKRSLFRLLESYSDAAVAYSSNAYSYYTQVACLPKERVFTAVNTIDTREKPFYCAALDANYFDIFFIGALIPSKKPLELLKAFHLLDQDANFLNTVARRLRLHFVGSGPSEQMLSDFVESNTIDNVLFHGFVSGGDLSLLLSVCDLVVMPGLGGLVVSEAIAHGVPVLAAQGDGSESDWLSLGAGKVIESSSTFILYEALKEALHPDLLPRYRECCLASLDAFGYPEYYKSFCRCLDSVCVSFPDL